MNLPLKLSEREKKFIIIGVVISVLIIISHVYSWHMDLRKEVKEISDAKLFMLEKQLNKIAEKDEIEKQISIIKQRLEKQEKMFLRGNKPPVAAAALQRFFKETVSSLGIDVKLERTLNPVDTEFYLGIPVEIGFTASTKKLQDLLFKLRSAPYLLIISEMKIRVTNISNPTSIYTTLVVTGFIKKPEGEVAGDKKESDAA
jgi:hypothetical protein